MFNSNDFNEVISSNPKKIQFQISESLSEEMLFTDIDNFPKYKGIYFLFLNTTNKELLYIGSVYANNRSIKDRLQQYLQLGSGGESFRGKIASLNNISDSDAIEFIKTTVTAKFIDMNKFDKDSIKQIEQVAIWANQPPLNYILKKFDFTQIDIIVE